jgi:nitroimidazol reductase NimA-like FMN-containing flavoprotein (pyridoxamine 5'-phosphate oxidase superfamily)
MADRSRITETALTDRGAAPWSLVQGRLETPEHGRTYWLATVRPDGAPHVMPLIGIWLDGAFYFVSGEKTRKGRDLAGEPRCVVAGSSTTLPSLDFILEGRAEPVTDEATLHRVTDAYGAKLEWPLEVRGDRVVGPNAPTAGPPPYAVFRIAVTTVFGLPGTAGMDQFDPSDLPRPTRWDIARAAEGGE